MSDWHLCKHDLLRRHCAPCIQAELDASRAEVARLRGAECDLIDTDQFNGTPCGDCAPCLRVLVKDLAGALELTLSTHDTGHSPCYCIEARAALAKVSKK